jgi:hypothetical protein
LRPRSGPGELAQRVPKHLNVVGGGVAAGVARTQQQRQRLAGAVRTVIDEHGQRVEAEPPLNVGRACSFSLCAVTRVASASTTSGRAASVPVSGALSPASDQT